MLRLLLVSRVPRDSNANNQGGNVPGFDDFDDSDEMPRTPRALQPGPGLAIEVRLAPHEILDFENRIIAGAIGEILGQPQEIAEDGHTWRPRLAQAIREQCRKEVAALTREHVDALVRETLLTEFTPTDSFGRVQGKPISLQAYVVAHVQDWLKAASYGDQGANLKKLVTDTVAAAFSPKGALRAELDGAVAAVKTQVTGRLTAELTAAVQRLVGK